MGIGGLTLVHGRVVGLQVGEAHLPREDDVAGKRVFCRRLKDVSFTLKIFLKGCKIFKHH